MVSHSLNPHDLRFNGLYFKSYQELARSTLIFSLADVMKLHSNAKITFSHRGATDLKKVFRSQTISRNLVMETG